MVVKCGIGFQVLGHILHWICSETVPVRKVGSMKVSNELLKVCRRLAARADPGRQGGLPPG